MAAQGAILLFLLHLASACKTYPWDPETSYGADAGFEQEPPEIDAGWDEDVADASPAGPDAGADAGAGLTPSPDAGVPDADMPAPDAGGGPALAIALPELGGRRIFSGDDVAARRLSFTHEGDEASCSRNGGAFGPCGEDDTFVWSAADYHLSHSIRVTQSGAPDTELQFTPSELQPGLEFVDCTDEVTADEDAATFNSRLTTPFAVVCLSDGVEISGPTLVGADNVTIMAPLGAQAFFTASWADAIDTNDHSGIDLVAVNALTSGGTLHAALRITSASTEVRLHDSEMRCEANNCYVLYVRGGIEVRRSLLLGGTQTSSYSYGVYGYGFSSRLDMEESEVRSRANTLYCAVGARFTVRNSELTSLYPNVSTHTGAVTVYNNSARLVLTNSVLRTGGLPAFLVGGGLPTYTTLDGNQIRKSAGTSTGEHDVIYSVSEFPRLYSTASNIFCNEGEAASDGEFGATLISGSYDTQQSTFDTAAQLGVANCSEF
jgi:hypothetical protein